MTETSKRPTFQFLPDAPVTEDKFGSHARVADSIAEIEQRIGHYYGLSSSEIDWIANYDIKYRMGIDGNDD